MSLPIFPMRYKGQLGSPLQSLYLEMSFSLPLAAGNASLLLTHVHGSFALLFFPGLVF